MPESELPYAESANRTYSAVDTTWKELLSVDADPNRDIYLRDITINSDYVIANGDDVRIQLVINGEKLLDNFQMVLTSFSLGFGGDLILKGSGNKTPIIIRTRYLATAHTTHVSAVVNGVQTIKSVKP